MLRLIWWNYEAVYTALRRLKKERNHDISLFFNEMGLLFFILNFPIAYYFYLNIHFS